MAQDPSWFQGLLGKLYALGVELELLSGINFGAGLTVERDEATDTWSVSATGEVLEGAAGGDLDGDYPDPTVIAINGTTVPAGGALATGAVLRATGAASAAWGAVNLADADAVTGVLPEANQADQTMGGDVSGSTSAAVVEALQGNAVNTDAPDNWNHLGWDGDDGGWGPRMPTQPTYGLNITLAGSGDSTTDWTAFTVPASPSGNGRFVITHILARLSSALVGAGTLAITIGSAAGGTQYLTSQNITSGTAAGTVYGITVSQLGSAFSSAEGYNVLVNAGAIVSVRGIGTGGSITGGQLDVRVYGFFIP